MVNPIIHAIGRPVTRAAMRYLRWRGHDVVGRPPYLYDEAPLRTTANHDFVDDPRFARAIRVSRTGKFAQRGQYHGRWSLAVLLWAAEHALKLDADIVIFGVFEGTESAAIADYCDAGGLVERRMILVDTYTGCSPELWTEEELKAGADSAQWAYLEAGDLYETVKARFARFKNVDVIQGRVPDILPSIHVERIGLLYVDMNAAAPERAALEMLWGRVVTGGIVISDDYGHSSKGHGYYAQKIAFDEFAASRGVSVLSLPTGQGMIVKP
jgi:O-methyltransferase